MGWTTNYSGPQIDETLEKGRDIRVVNNGWINIESSQSSPIALNTLKNPGNYIIFYWTDGPAVDANMHPLNITVALINDVIYQFVNALGYTYSRVVNSDNTVSAWVIDQTAGILKPGASAPTTLVDGKTLWLDTSKASAPVLKLYSGGNWQEVIPTTVMQSTIYDPQGKKSDIFKYIEDSMDAIFNVTGSISFDEHIAATDLHVTASEKTAWDNAPTNESLITRVTAIKADIDNDIINGFGDNISKFTELEQEIIETEVIYEHHAENETIHPTSDKRDEWDNKAESIHEHKQDGRVSISPSNVHGTISTDKLPYDVKERVYVVNSIDEMYSYTFNPVHNGDFFCVETDDGTSWYVVIDETSLGTDYAEYAFRLLSVPVVADWANVKNAPTTLAAYGIIDAATQTDVTNLDNRTNSIRNRLSATDEANIKLIADAEAARNEIYSILANGDPFELLEATVARLEAITE